MRRCHDLREPLFLQVSLGLTAQLLLQAGDGGRYLVVPRVCAWVRPVSFVLPPDVGEPSSETDGARVPTRVRNCDVLKVHTCTAVYRGQTCSQESKRNGVQQLI